MSTYAVGAGWNLITSREPFKGFFQMKTASEFAVSGLNVALEPFNLLITLSLALLEIGWHTLDAIRKLLSGEPRKAMENIHHAGAVLIRFPIFLITALLSPLLNLIDILGSAINMLLPEAAHSEGEFGHNW